MKVSTVATLWDYIRRAMPGRRRSRSGRRGLRGHRLPAQPRRRGARRLRAATDHREAQALLPNRNGTTTDHAVVAGRRAAQARRAGQGLRMSNCEAPGAARLLPARLRAQRARQPAPSKTAWSARSIRRRHHAAAGDAARAAPAAPPEGRGSWRPPRSPAQLHRLPCGRREAGRPGPPTSPRKHAGRCRGLPGRQDPAGGSGVWGAIPDAAAEPRRGRRTGHRPMAGGRRRQKVTDHFQWRRTQCPLPTIHPQIPQEKNMQTRRRHAGALRVRRRRCWPAGLLPQAAQTPGRKAAFDAKTMGDADEGPGASGALPRART